MGGRGASSSQGQNAFDVISDEEYSRAYNSYIDKRNAYMDRGIERWSAKEYTNAEFLAHLEDSNWHSEMRQLQQANLTPQQLTKLKNNVDVGPYTVYGFTGKEAVAKRIAEVKKTKRK